MKGARWKGVSEGIKPRQEYGAQTRGLRKRLLTLSPQSTEREDSIMDGFCRREVANGYG